jgi:hypothetical protein
MTIDSWAILAAALMALAAGFSGLILLEIRGPWRWLAVVARLAGVVILALALMASAEARGEWSPFDLQQVALALALAAVALGLLLTWLRRIQEAGLVLDLAVLVLVLLAAFAIYQGGPRLSCDQRSLLFGVRWALFLLGAGGALIMGTLALTLVLAIALPGRASPGPLRRLLADATFSTLLALGLGLVASVCWSWRAAGSLGGGDARLGWMAATWLVAGMSLLAWQMERRAGRWATALAAMAAAIALVGLLVVPDLMRLWGF